MTKNIDLRALQKAVNRLFDHVIIDKGISEVELRSDLYWEIAQADIRDLSKTPVELEVGNLNDDWEFVSSLVSEEVEPVVCQLTEIAPLLRYIGENVPEN